jgi:hypothetical protein
MVSDICIRGIGIDGIAIFRKIGDDFRDRYREDDAETQSDDQTEQ